ncbi:MAG: amidohydrolase family protein [Planctomycetaceae bacterium]|jgi:imidazolonepropionase-like amidohydrolase|nr:amidohydrolase family protein [Phycisphaerales bacterium]MCE2652079.1 amidohydrolase family protein [Planctomycetaceae bacterium]
MTIALPAFRSASGPTRRSPRPRHLAGLLAIAGSLLTAASATAQDLTRRAKPQEMPIAVVNASVHPVSGPPIPNGFVRFADGKISEVGSMEGGRMFTADTVIIDAAGKHVYPGLIGPYTQLGITELGSVRATRDFNEAGDITPEVYAAVAVNPDSTLLPVTRTNGVLAAGVFPTGGTMPGRASAIVMEGWTWEDMTVKRDLGLVVSWPFMRTVRAAWMDRSEEEQLREIRTSLERIRETFRTAQAYADRKAAAPDTTPTDVRYEAMRSVMPARGPSSDPASPGPLTPPALPLFVEAADYDQITSAIAFSKQFGVRIIIVGGRDAPLCADLLKANNIPVIISGTHVMPKRDDSDYDEPYRLPARLHAAGIPFAIASGEETPHERNLPYVAGMAAAHGLPRDVALRAITLSAAEILGIADTLGSLQPGKSATLIITDGDPLEVGTNVERAFIRGSEITLRNKQTDLADKYREKYTPGSPAAPKPADAPAPR